MSQLKPLFNAEQINDAVIKLGRVIVQDYESRNPLLIGILKGSFMFMAGLVREIEMPLEVDFVKLSSYGKGRKESSGKIKVVKGLNVPVVGKDILVIEDIVDSGLTLSYFLDHLRHKKPASLKVCTLFDKPSRREISVHIDYVGLTIPDAFVVGYGLDYDEKYRNLPGLYILSDDAGGE
jgi:hypoxanthine phosphoribosyltransferase